MLTNCCISGLNEAQEEHKVIRYKTDSPVIPYLWTFRPPTTAECIPPLPRVVYVSASIHKNEAMYTESPAFPWGQGTQYFALQTCANTVAAAVAKIDLLHSLGTFTAIYNSPCITQYSHSPSRYPTSRDSSAGERLGERYTRLNA